MTNDDANDEFLSQIRESAYKLGIKPKHIRTLVDIKNTADETTKGMFLQAGEWQSEEPWFCNMGGELFLMVKSSTINNLLSQYNAAKHENFTLQLEKAIMKQMPIDYRDVWTVVMEEVKKITVEKERQISSLNLDSIVAQVKKDYPNLFVKYNG